jgi:hypothetical protein
MQDLVKHLKPVDDSSILEHSPWKETYFAVRAILPLLIVLVFLVVVVLRKVIFFKKTKKSPLFSRCLSRW